MMLSFLSSLCVDKRRVERSLGIACFVACGLSFLGGCKPTADDAGSAVPPAATVPSEVDAQLRKSTQDFDKQVQSGDFTKASAILSVKLAKQMPVSALSQMVKDGALKPLATAMPFRFDSVQMSRGGEKATVRLGFDTPTQKNYRMNFVFVKAGTDWKIDTIVPPVKPEKPMASGGSLSGKSN